MHVYRNLSNPTVAMTVIRPYINPTAHNMKPIMHRIANSDDCVSLDIFFIWFIYVYFVVMNFVVAVLA